MKTDLKNQRKSQKKTEAMTREILSAETKAIKSDFPLEVFHIIKRKIVGIVCSRGGICP